MTCKRLILSVVYLTLGLIVTDPFSSGAYNLSTDYAGKYFFPIIGIRINGGVKYTNNTTVSVEVKSLKLPDSLIAEMRVGTMPDLTSSEWKTYSTAKFDLTLTGGDGQKLVYAQLRDKAGNMSPIESSAIILDTTPPEKCRFLINQGEKYTNDNQGRVVLFIQAEEEISQMEFSS